MTPFKRTHHKVYGLLLTAALGAAQPLPAFAEESYRFDIATNDASQAIHQFGTQAGVQILASAEQLQGRRLNEVDGTLSTDDGLKQLLSGTGLTHRYVGDRTIALVLADKHAAAAASTTQENTQQNTKRSFWERLHLAQVVQAGVARDGSVTTSDNASEGRSSIEEIIVTAQKRQERLQDVPISISVLGGGDLDQSTAEGVSEALNRVPGVITTGSAQGAGAQVAVRGVSAGGPLFNGSSPIAYYLDSVPFGLVKTAVVPDSSAYDLERIEVLRGPQGTLYGASAQNGVVRVLTKDANLDEFEGKTRLLTSSTQHGGTNYRADAALNAPIVPGKLAARAVLGYEDLSGWIDTPVRKDVNDAELRNARIKVNASPTDELSIGLLAWLSRSDYGSPSTADDQRRRASTLDESIAIDYDVYGIKAVYEFPAFSVSSMSSYIDYANDGGFDFLLPLSGSSGLLATRLDSEVWSEEVTLNSTASESWRWSLGGIYRDAEDRLVQTLPALLPGPVDFTDLSESFAVFGEVTRILMAGRLELTVGLRYFEDEVTQQENVAQLPARPTDPVLPPMTRKFDATTPRLVVTWHPAQNSTLYGSYSEGFRSGFSQNANVTRRAPQFPPVQADELKNYEIGSKGILWAGKLSYEAAVFYIDWDDVQQTLTVDLGGVPATALVNGESASGMGAEFGLTLRPTDRLEFGVSFSWNELEIDSALTSVASSIALYDEGDRLNFSAEYVAGASADYVLPIGGGYEARFSASATYNSEQLFRNVLGSQVLLGESEAMLIGRTRFSLDTPHRWTASVFVDNVTNEQDRGVSLFDLADFIQRVRPRTVGLQVEYRF